MPCTEIAFCGPAYDVLYHTTGDVPSCLDPKAFRANTVYNALALLRFDQMGIVDYDLHESLSVAQIGTAAILQKDHRVFAAGRADMSALQEGMDAYAAVLAEKAPVLDAAGVSKEEAARVNQVQMAAEKALLPHLFDWDSSGIPGWTGIVLFDTYANDLGAMNKAIAQLKVGNTAGCARYLEGVTTMGWRRYVGRDAYDLILEHIAYNPHLLRGKGFIPQLTDVHDEYSSLTGRAAEDAMSEEEVLASLTEKRDAIYGFVTMASEEAGTAFSEAAALLETL